MKILYVISSAGIGGAEQVVKQDLLRLSRTTNYQIGLACPSGPLATLTHNSNIKHHMCSFSSISSAIIELVDIIQRERYHIVHTNLYLADVAGIIAARLAGCRMRFSTVHGHNFFYHKSFGTRRLHYAGLKFVFRWPYMMATRIIAPAKTLVQHLCSPFPPNVSQEKIVVIPNATSVHHNDSLPYPIEPSVCVVANFDIIKGHEVFFKALPLIYSSRPECKVVLIGSGPELERYKKLAAEYIWSDKIIFMGCVNEPRKIMRKSSVISLTSWSEGLPMALLEAMAEARPVVATAVGGIPEQVKNGVHGYLVPAGDYRAVARKILGLLADVDTAAYIGKQGQEHVTKNHSIDRRVRFLVQEYQHACL